MRAFFRSLFQGEPGVDSELADRLAGVCERHINRMLVWDAKPLTAGRRHASQLEDIETPVTPVPQTVMTEAGAHWPDHDQGREKEPQESQGRKTPVATETFDPYAFSVVVVLARNGPGALLDRLCEIDCPANLHQLAEAQHVAIDRSISDLADLRAAIVVGAKQRLSDRSAAAS